jgi:hypothetical protein
VKWKAWPKTGFKVGRPESKYRHHDDDDDVYSTYISTNLFHLYRMHTFLEDLIGYILNSHFIFNCNHNIVSVSGVGQGDSISSPEVPGSIRGERYLIAYIVVVNFTLVQEAYHQKAMANYGRTIPRKSQNSRKGWEVIATP